MKVLSRDPGRKLERRAANGLAIRAVTQPYQIGVNACLPSDVTALAYAINFHRP